MKIKDICEYGLKSKIKAGEGLKEGKYKFFTSSLVCNKYLNIFQFENEGIIMGTGGNTTLHYCSDKFSVSTDCVVLFSKPNIECKYLYYFFKKNMQILEEGFKGAGLKHTNKNYINNIEIKKIPSLCDQSEIVKILDKVQLIINKRNAQVEELDLLVKSRFVEMFGDPVSNPFSWERVQLDDCLESIDNGKSFVCENNARVGYDPAMLKLSAVTYGVYKPDENKTIIDINDFVESAEVHDGDLLFTRKNTPELVGMSAYVKSTPKKLMMPDLIFRLNTKENCHKVFLWQLINHDLFRSQIQNLASGSAKSMSNISKERLRKLVIALPPINLQEQFIEFVQATDKLKVEVQKSLDEIQVLFDSLIQKYFE